jgi:CheY-like chemotaxis protein/GAF domain-containing protein
VDRLRARASVLVVDDDPDIAALVADCLEMEGYAVATVHNGRQALEALGAAHPDAIVLDLMMPEMDGFAFLRRYAQLEAPRSPVVATSAFDAYLDAARGEGAHAVLRKPFTIDALVSAVRRLVSGRDDAAAVEALPPVPPPDLDERERLMAVMDLRLDQPAPTAAMDAFVKRVAALFDVPICLVSIVTHDRQYWHAFCGLSPDLEAARGSPREDSFCTHAVVAQAALVVQDAIESPIFATNPFVARRGLRFYAGVPLTSRFGQVVGTLCILDSRPRTFRAFDLELLGVLSRRVVAEIEWRERRATPSAPQAAFRYLTWLDEELDLLGREAFVQALQVMSLLAGETRAPLTLAVISVEPQRVEAAAADLKAAFPQALFGRLGMARLGLLAHEDMDAVRRRADAAAGAGASLDVARVPRIAGGATQFLALREAALGQAGLALPR